jgi:activator of HSP90 ATPase
MSASIHQEVVIKANPQRVYEVLTDAQQFSAFTGGKAADIDREPGGAFSCFGGMITGRNIELVPNRRIVQAWRAGNWPEGVYSIVRFELETQGTDTKLTFDQSGFPDSNREHLESGWSKMYWDPLRVYLA